MISEVRSVVFLWKCYPALAKILCWSNCFMAILSILYSAIMFFTTKTQSIQSQGMMHGSVLHSNLTSVLTNFKVFDLIYVIICFITILYTILFFYTLSFSTIGRWVSCGPWVSCSGVILELSEREVLQQFQDFREKFWSKFWISLYILYIFTFSSA